jgi:hypothetical protein
MMGVIIARNMLNWLELLINRYCCIWLVVYIFCINDEWSNNYQIYSQITLYCMLRTILILITVIFNHHNNNFNHMCNFWHVSSKHNLHMLEKAPWRWPTLKAETCRSINWHIKVFCNKFVSNFTCANSCGIYGVCNALVCSTWYDTEWQEIHHKYHKCARALQATIEHEHNLHLLYFATLFTQPFAFRLVIFSLK